jgi:hypothetical protein
LSTCILTTTVLAAAIAAASCDPVLSGQKDALAGETPGVPKGPLHRPGQPCLLCHDGSIGDPPAFSVAGTVYQDATTKVALENATVTLTDVNGATYATVTNAAGYFYLSPDDFAPAYPMKVSVASGGVTVSMQSHVGWNGACGGCHVDPPGPDSPGHVYFNVPNGLVP